MHDEKCKICGTKIVFLVTKDHSLIAVNNVGIATIIDDNGKLHRGHVPHFATCSDPEKFQKRG